MEDELFKVDFLKPARDFLLKVADKPRTKILANIRAVQLGKKDSELFKKLDGTDIWEFRTRYMGIAYRLFCFWDSTQKRLVVATHGIIKKTQKTPPKEIARAEELSREYLEGKNR